MAKTKGSSPKDMKSICLSGTHTGTGVETLASFQFEDGAYVHAIALCLEGDGVTATNRYLAVSKDDGAVANLKTGILALLVAHADFAATIGVNGIEMWNQFFDFKPGYFRVEEDEYLYLIGQDSGGVDFGKGKALIYYTDID